LLYHDGVNMTTTKWQYLKGHYS